MRTCGNSPPWPIGRCLWAPTSALTRKALIRYDYRALIAAVAPFADYAVINISSPNTKGLRDLQGEAQLRAILAAVVEVERRPPILVKIAPDLSDDGIASVVETCVSFGVQGLIVGNTTITRPAGLRSAFAGEAGGLSGVPLFQLANKALARAFLAARGDWH